MNTSELRNKNVAELKTELLATKKERFNLRMQATMSDSAPKPHLHKQVKRKIAQIKTIINEKEQSSD